MNLIASFDAKTQEQSLVLGLAKIKNMKGDMAKLIDAWIAGDAVAIDKELNKDRKEHPEAEQIMQNMIYDRNGPMAAKIEDYLKGNKTVFVVGRLALPVHGGVTRRNPSRSCKTTRSRSSSHRQPEPPSRRNETGAAR